MTVRFFNGYPRKTGPPGIRNTVLLVAGCLECNAWVTAAATELGEAGICAVTHKSGMGNIGADRDTFRSIMRGLATHPNVAGIVVIGSGNEDDAPALLVEAARAAGRRASLVRARSISSSGSLLRRARERARSFADEAAGAERIQVPLGELRIGLNCAGTDTSSARTSNAACGVAADRLVRGGATVVLSETSEMFGVSEEFLARCSTVTVRRRLEAAIRRQARRLQAAGAAPEQGALCRFNLEGGVTSTLRKADISVMKGGTSPVVEVCAYGSVPARRGLVVMDGPAMTDFVVCGHLGAGTHMMVNCCGVGPANRLPAMVGADAVPPFMPVVKVTGSSSCFRGAANRIDFDAGLLLEHPDRVEELGDALFEKLAAVASGERTRTELPGGYFVNFPLRHHQA